MTDLVLRPHQGLQSSDHRSGDPLPPYDRESAINDLTFSDWRRTGVAKRAQARADSYFANFTLGATPDGKLSATDSLGQPIPIPDGLTAMRLIHLQRPRAYVTPYHNAWPESAWLAFFDADGVARLLLPGYGWDPQQHLRNQLTPATSITLDGPALGDDVSLKWAKMNRNYPGWTSAVFVPIGRGPKTLTAWSKRFDEDLRFA